MTQEERAQAVIKQATRIMKRGYAKGWSDALRQAEDEIQRRANRG